MSMAFCRGCGKEIHESAVACPHCGATLKKTMTMGATDAKSQTLAAVLAALVGALGIHKFYLGNIVSGILYFLFCWTGIPAVIAAFETYAIAFMTPQNWARKYNNGELGQPVNGVLKIVLLLPCILLMVAVIGIVAAVAIPAYQNYHAKSRVSISSIEIQNSQVQFGTRFS